VTASDRPFVPSSPVPRASARNGRDGDEGTKGRDERPRDDKPRPATATTHPDSRKLTPGETEIAGDQQTLRAFRLNQVMNKFKTALKAGASVTFTHSGTVAIVTVECGEGTFTGYGDNAVAALDVALTAIQEQ
jgi:hypothetical protein